jgi:uncharacterized protein
MKRAEIKFIDALSMSFKQTSATLEVEFADGSVYQFFDVPDEVMELIRNSQGPDKSLLSLIKGKYRFAKT